MAPGGGGERWYKDGAGGGTAQMQGHARRYPTYGVHFIMFWPTCSPPLSPAPSLSPSEAFPPTPPLSPSPSPALTPTEVSLPSPPSSPPLSPSGALQLDSPRASTLDLTFDEFFVKQAESNDAAQQLPQRVSVPSRVKALVKSLVVADDGEWLHADQDGAEASMSAWQTA